LCPPFGSPGQLFQWHVQSSEMLCLEVEINSILDSLVCQTVILSEGELT
jgi:hypothetical protein